MKPMSITSQRVLTRPGLPGDGEPPTTGPPAPERAFEVVALSEYLGMISLILFLAAIGTRQLVGLLPYRLQGYHMMPPLAVLMVPVVSGIGVLFALFGRHHGGAARIGLVANTCVLALSLLLVLAALGWRTVS